MAGKERKTRSEEPGALKETQSCYKAKLQKYLKEGTRDHFYKDGTPHVFEIEVRDLALRAGYTNLALGYLDGQGSTDLVVSKEQPKDGNITFTVSVRVPTSIPTGSYGGIEFVGWYIDNNPPDFPEGQDELQIRILEELAQFDLLRKQLNSSGKQWLSLDLWDFCLDGSIMYWLNPFDQERYSSGWYSLNDLRGWLENDPNCPILMQNNEELSSRRRLAQRGSFKDVYSKQLDELSRGGGEKSRLLTIALMKCPFPDLVERYWVKE